MERRAPPVPDFFSGSSSLSVFWRLSLPFRPYFRERLLKRHRKARESALKAYSRPAKALPKGWNTNFFRSPRLSPKQSRLMPINMLKDGLPEQSLFTIIFHQNPSALLKIRVSLHRKDCFSELINRLSCRERLRGAANQFREALKRLLLLIQSEKSTISAFPISLFRA